jgi:Ran GTPase-activating protein (RanGAP) involved in mRNA processing and transport
VKFNGPQFKQLSLSGSNLTADKLAVLAQGLSQTSLEYVDLTWNRICKENIDDLCALIRQNTSLKILLLQHNELGETAMQNICKAIND